MSQSQCLDGTQPRFGVCVDSATGKLFSDSLPKPPQPESPEASNQKQIDAAPTRPFGTVAPFEKLKGYMNPDVTKTESFFRFDDNKDGQITRVEMKSALERTVNTEELLMLHWLSDHMSTLENLADTKPGFGTNDMAAFRKVYEEGPGNDWVGALRKHSWLTSASVSYSASFILQELITRGNSSVGKVAFGAVMFTASSALNAVLNYQKEQKSVAAVASSLKNLNEFYAPQ